MTATHLTVQAGFGYAVTADDIEWTDITARVALSDTEGPRITRGAEDEKAETQTGTLSLDLDNQDGAVTPGNTSSPYYPNVRRNCPIRVISTVLGGKNYLTQPGFEVPDTGWSALDEGGPVPAPAAINSDRAKSGTYSFKIGWDDSGTGGVVQCPLYGLLIGRPHTASVYVWVPTGDPAVRLDIDGTTVGTASSLTNQWQRITVTWTPTAASHMLRITTNTTSPVIGDLCWLDEAQVEEGSSATTWSSTPATHHARFFGMVTSWPMGWEGLHSTATVTASDMLKWPGRRPALGPMLVEEVQSDEAQLYYPLSEPESSTTAGDQSGNARPSLAIVQAGTGGTLVFGQGIGPPSDGLSTPMFTPVNSTNGKFLRCFIDPLLTSSGSTGTPIPGDLIVEAWFSTSTTGRVILTLSAGAATAFDSGIYFYLESGSGQLKINEFFPVGSTVTTVATPNLADGAVHHLVWDEAGQDVYVDGVQYVVPTGTWQDMLVLTVGATSTGTDLWSGSISHVAAYVANLSQPAVAAIVDHYEAGTTGHAGEDSWARMVRLASYAKITGVLSAGLYSAVASQGELGSSPLSHMRDVERTEGGKLFADRASAQLVFQSRSVRYNPAITASIEYADLETNGVEFSDDDQKLVNLIRASRPGGAEQRIQSAESIAAYGTYEQQLDVLKTTDEAVVDAATWEIVRYADPLPEMRQLPVDAATLPTATFRALLDADISSVIEVTDLPTQAPAATATVTVEGYVEQITEGRHVLNYRVSRSDIDAVWVLDDPTHSVLDTSTRLAY
ncbi:LamG-like jellyroll fold domain-containing protein [Streptomyces sp. NPDC056543]|uniref:LamG-like jellyroll fold domain-containing protein n=1 Tax=unclassified Streptomyces TaxID=2593676 RepID=UPI0036B61783